MSTSTRRRLLGGIGYLAFLFVFVEIALQVFYYATAGDFLFARTGIPIYAPNEWSGVFNKPNLAYEHHTHEFHATNFTNGQGLRVPEGQGDYALAPPPGTRRVLLLGPSFAYGWGVDYEQTFGHRLERLLEERGWANGSRVELINAGVPSLGVAPHLNWFRHVGQRFQPSLVVQFVYGTVAVKNELDVPTRVDEAGYLVNRNASWGRMLRDRAKKLATVFYAWIVVTRVDAMLSGDEESSEVVGAGREMQIHRDFDVEAPAVRESLDYYRELREEMRRAGADLIVVHFPLSYAVHREDVARWRHLGVRDIEAQRAFDSAFCRHLSEHEAVPCIDISESLRSHAESHDERLYYWLDVHWTPAGNDVAAAAVADYLTHPGPGTSAAPASR